MSKTVTAEAISKAHVVHLNGRKDMEVDGVEQIIAFDERQILLRTSEGKMQITGKDMKVTALQPESGKAHVTGEIDNIAYIGKSRLSHRKLLQIFR